MIPVENIEDMSAKAQDGILIGNQVDKAQLANPLARRMVANFDAAVLSLLALAQPKTIHEVGCGEGRLARMIQPQYPVPFRASDFSRELTEENLRQGPPEILFVCRSIYELNATEDGAGVILCCEVLEHLEDPAKGLLALRGAGAGQYILSVPNEPVWRVLNFCRGKYWRDFGNTPGHLNHWSPAGFCRFLEAHGFKVSRRLQPFPWTMVLGHF